jgi:type I restriction enzyme M protein
MSELSNRIVQKLWSYCNILRDDGLSYQDYLEQLTYILFLKMADERAAITGEEQAIPKGYRWSDLANPAIEGVRLEEHYREALRKLGVAGGMLGLIFRKAQNKIQDPAKLRQLVVELIGREDWLAMSSDVKGEAYEGLLERNAQGIKSGAGQYFTPRPLISAIVDCIQPQPGEVIVDPACGTGGFLLAAHAYLTEHSKLDRDQKKHLKFEALRGVEIVDGVSRLCAMNLFLHGVGPDDERRQPPIKTDDALRNEPSSHADVVMTNPPVLRSQAGQRQALDEDRLRLRPPHEPALHAEGTPDGPGRPRGFRGLLSPRPASRTQADVVGEDAGWALAGLCLR